MLADQPSVPAPVPPEPVTGDPPNQNPLHWEWVPDQPFDWEAMAAWSAFAVAVLALIGVVTWRVRAQTQHRQAEEIARLRHEVNELRRQLPALNSDDDSLVRIGAETRVFQIGDYVEVIDGPHRGDHGAIANSPDWLKKGYVCVDLVRAQAHVYMAASRLGPLDR